MNIVNLTPHALNVRGTDGSMTTIEPSGTVARCQQSMAQSSLVLPGFSVQTCGFGAVEGLPAEADQWCHGCGTDACGCETTGRRSFGNIYVVSALAAQAAWADGRTDVVTPGQLQRDASGVITGCNGFFANPSLATTKPATVAGEAR